MEAGVSEVQLGNKVQTSLEQELMSGLVAINKGFLVTCKRLLRAFDEAGCSSSRQHGTPWAARTLSSEIHPDDPKALLDFWSSHHDAIYTRTLAFGI